MYLKYQKYLKEFIGRKIYILGPLEPMVSQSSWRRTEKLCFDSGVDVLFEMIRKSDSVLFVYQIGEDSDEILIFLSPLLSSK
jgi:hypothetical protein